MPRMGGLELLRALKDDGGDYTVVILTAQGTVETAVEAIKEGAYDYLNKPIEPQRLKILLDKIVERLETMREVKALRRQLREHGTFGSLIGNSAEMRKIYQVVEQAAPTAASVLITGESGTGKELIAQTIHQLSPRAGFPFIAIPGSQVKSSKLPAGIPTGYWRAPGDNGNIWATQCFVDELAHAAGRDPLAFTLDLLASVPAGGRFDPAKMKTVLERATQKAGWGKSRPRGEGQGLAITHTNNAYVAIVADVSVSREGELTINKLTAVVDAGTIINLSAAESQVQGAMLDGISAAWFQKITIEHGAAAQTNFHEYAMLRMNHSPRVVDVEFIKSVAPPTGLGEPGLPAAAPALCNAIFAATGKRVRTLPIADASLKWS